MKNIWELFYDQPGGWHGIPNGQDSPFVRTARIKSENLEMLNESMTDGQKQLMEAYFNADTKIESMINLDRFQYAFHLGARLMTELIQGKEELLKSLRKRKIGLFRGFRSLRYRPP